ncbi:hypothetical protein AB1Y20_004696 [Prymnesium parvum]|uniref:General transcription factor IIH subunit 3 n=1 Tax=Prymnesium parvum TaxID=97485 RepID=A0AB34IYW0_PRYPA
MLDDLPSTLICLVDCNPCGGWGEEDALALLEHLLVFFNAFLLLHSANQLQLLAVHPREVSCVWPEDGAPPALAPHQLRQLFLKRFRTLLATPPPSASAASALSGGLSLALCRLARQQRADATRQLRVLVVQATADSAAQHLAGMNCVFGAQKLGVTIDALVAARNDSLLLQQAAHLTDGFYLRLGEQEKLALSQYLLTCCLPDQQTRKLLCPPAQGSLETKALCTISKRPVDIGHACSVCLAVFAEDQLPLRECPVCGSRFIQQAAQAPKKRPKKAAAAAAPAVTS